jgi:hypothetical protein
LVSCPAPAGPISPHHLREGIDDGFRAFEGFRIAPHHDRKLSVLRSSLTAETGASRLANPFDFAAS